MSFDFAAAQAQLASINAYAGESIVLGGVTVKATLDQSRAGEVFVAGGIEVKISCVATIAKSQLAGKPVHKTLATVRGDNVKVIDVAEDGISYTVTFGWAFSL